MKVYLDNILITSTIEGIESYEISHMRNDDEGIITRSISNELTFRAEAYDLLKAKLIDDVNAKINEVKITIEDDCCGSEQFNGIIRGDGIEWTEGECAIRAQILEDSATSDQYNCLRSQLIKENLPNKKHPRISYCTELRPAFLMDFVIIAGVLLNVTYATFYPLVLVISLLIVVVDAIPGVSVPEKLEDGILEEYSDLRGMLNRYITGCGNQHPSPLVRDYLQGVCDKCGITLVSSILNNPQSAYHNTVLLTATSKEGLPKGSSIQIIEDNLPNWTGIQFLDFLKTTFNAKYKIINNQLQFERRDFFKSNNRWIDYEQVASRITQPANYSFLEEGTPAAATFNYLPDGFDEVGNEAKERFNKVINWNDPERKAQSGVREYNLQVGVSRYRGDNVARDILAWWNNIPAVNSILSGHLDNASNVLIMSKGIAANPKLLVWDTSTSIDDARVVKSGDKFNAPYFFDNLYNEFFYIDNPRNSAANRYQFSFTFKATCAELQDFNIDKSVRLGMGDGEIQEATIKHADNTVTVKGII